MGTRVYISSTFADLELYREAVHRALRKSRLEVVAMEDYVARDDRPLSACLADVAKADVYVGIFAWRYGFVPEEDNPEGRSITELEYRHAVDQKIPCLIFLLAEGVPWVLDFTDSHTKEGEAGERIAALRRELGDEHVVSFFENPDQLASRVQSAVGNQIADAREELVAPRRDAVLHPREITHPLLLAYADADRAVVDRLTAARPRGVLLVPEGLLFARDAAELERLEGCARRAERAAVALSAPILNRFAEDPATSRRVLSVLRARTGRLDAFCGDAASVARAEATAAFDAVHDLSALGNAELARLAASGAAAGGRAIGLPYLVVAMTREEAEQLDRQPELIEMALDRPARERFESLRRQLDDGGRVAFTARYGESRESWRPFDAAPAGDPDAGDPDAGVPAAAGPDVATLLGEVVERLGTANRSQLRGRRLKLQLYPFDALIEQDAVLRPVYGDVASSGCLVIVDELSLCHPRISRAASQLFGLRQVAVATVSPLDPRRLPPYQLLEQELSRSLGFAFDRFDRDLDPQCELGVGNARRLKRWLFSSLPETASRLFEPEPAPARVRDFARELGLEDDRSVASELYSEGGGL